MSVGDCAGGGRDTGARCGAGRAVGASNDGGDANDGGDGGAAVGAAPAAGGSFVGGTDAGSSAGVGGIAGAIGASGDGTERPASNSSIFFDFSSIKRSASKLVNEVTSTARRASARGPRTEM